MVIAIPLDKETTEEGISVWFGRCSHILIVDTNGYSSIVENTAVVESGGAGIKTAQSLIDKNVDVLITLSIGAKAIKLLRTAGIKVYEGKGNNVENNLELLKSNSLKELESSNK